MEEAEWHEVTLHSMLQWAVCPGARALQPRRADGHLVLLMHQLALPLAVPLTLARPE